VDIGAAVFSERHPRRDFLLDFAGTGHALRIIGSKGRIELDQFWFAGGKQGGTSAIRIIGTDGSRSEVVVDEPLHLYSFEVDAASDAIRAGRTDSPTPE
jgi:predicted dehydrogenase